MRFTFVQKTPLVQRRCEGGLDSSLADAQPADMFGFLKKDPKKKLRASYERLLAEANALQRKGDIRGYASKMAEAEEVGRKLDEAEA